MEPDLISALVDLRREDVLAMVGQMADQGDDPLRILQACRRAMTTVGERYQRGEYCLAELILSGEILKEVAEILEPHLAAARPEEPVGTVVLATLKGDIHDLGKNLFKTLVAAQGFAVCDLGVDVDAARVVETVRELKPDFVGFSALMTPAFHCMKQAADLLKEAGLRNRVRIMIGGGVTTPKVKEYVGADFQTTDAMEGVTYCLDKMKGR
jgi:methanogenic corrinoid protein MtbC1